MDGRTCPRCGARDTHWLSTTNEWKYYCPHCDFRFNKHDQILGDKTVGRHSGALAALRLAGEKSKLNPETEMELLVKRQVQALEIIALILSEGMDFLEVLALRMEWGVEKGPTPKKSGRRKRKLN